MHIRVVCKSPKYACGKFEFNSLEELLQWLHSVKSVSSPDLSRFIFAIAKDGELKLAKYGLHLDIESDSPDYFLANRLAEEIGLITYAGKIKEDERKVTTFAKSYDAIKA